MKRVKGGTWKLPESFLAITQKVRIVERSNCYFWNPRKISYKIGANLGQIEQKLKFSFFKILFFINIYLYKNQSYWSNLSKIAENVNYEWLKKVNNPQSLRTHHFGVTDRKLIKYVSTRRIFYHVSVYFTKFYELY